MRSIASRMSVMSGEGALSVFARAKELEAQGRSIIHLELGEPDFHPGKSVIDSASRALAEGKDRYCNVIGIPALRHDIATYLARTRSIQVSPDNIVIGRDLNAARAGQIRGDVVTQCWNSDHVAIAIFPLGQRSCRRIDDRLTRMEVGFAELKMNDRAALSLKFLSARKDRQRTFATHD